MEGTDYLLTTVRTLETEVVNLKTERIWTTERGIKEIMMNRLLAEKKMECDLQEKDFIGGPLTVDDIGRYGELSCTSSYYDYGKREIATIVQTAVTFASVEHVPDVAGINMFLQQRNAVSSLYCADELEVDVNEAGDYILCHYDGKQSIPLEYEPIPSETVNAAYFRGLLDKMNIAYCF